MFSAIADRIRAVLQRRRVARELDDELQFHLEMEIGSHVERGVPYPEARRIALRDFGGVQQTKEDVRDVRALWVESSYLDVRYALRALWSHPAFSLTAVVMLGLAIGITTAMFTLVDALILRPVPFRAPEQLAFVYMGNEHGGAGAVAPGVLRAWRASRAFSGVEAAVPGTALIELDGTLAARQIARVTPGLFDLLGGVRPLRGRLFDRSDGQAGNDDRVLLSEDVWRQLYGADPAIVDRRIKVDGAWLTVVGIVPAEFRFPSWNTVMWRATDFEPPGVAGPRPIAYVRFASDMPRADAVRLATAAAREADSANAKLWLQVNPLAGMVLDPYYQRAVPLLAGGVLLVFLVLCANVGGLLLTRATARHREFGMRAALGASRARLVRQAVVESSLIGTAGAVAGAGIGWALVSLTRAFLPEAFLLRTLNPLNLDARALAVTAIAGLVAVLLAGFLPAWLGTRIDAGSLRVTDRGGTETRGARAATRALLVGEIALACTLLLGATLLVRSFVNLTRAGRGLDASGVLTATVSLPRADFPDPASRAAVARSLEQRVRELPGVEQVAWSYGLPPSGGAISFGTWQSDAPGGRNVYLVVEHYNVSADFFSLYGIPLLRGRSFHASDPAGAVIVSERLAAVLWPGLDPIGRTFLFERDRPHVVIGVAREIRLPSTDPRRDRPEFYAEFAGVGSYAMMSIRCTHACPDPALVRQRLVSTAPGPQVVDVRPLEETYLEELARPRAAAALGFTFAFIALVAAAGGLFTVLTYAVNRRRREFGIRSAMGASPARIARLVLGDGALIASAGIAVGLGPAWVVARALRSVQYEVTTTDPATWTLVIALLASVTALASWRPAREATRIDPALLLKSE